MNETPLPPNSRPTSPTETGLPRRTLIAGAAWSVPAIVAITAVPAYASSAKTRTLEFDKTTYSASGCAPITGGRVRAFDDGAIVAGAAISATLSNGYTFAGGGTSYSGTSAGNGWLTLPDIATPAAGGSGTVTAVSNGVSKSAGLLTSGASGIVRNGSVLNSSAVPSGSVPISADVFLTPDGRVISGSTVYATGVASAGWVGVNSIVPVKKTDDTFATISVSSIATTAAPAVPVGSTPLGGNLFLTTTGNLIDAAGTVWASSIDTYASPTDAIASDGGGWFFGVRLRDGSCGMVGRSSRAGASARPRYTASTTVPAGSVPIVDQYFLTPTGDFVQNGTTAPIATGIASAGRSLYPGGATVVYPAVTTGGVAVRIVDDYNTGLEVWSTNPTTGVAASSRPVAGPYFLQPDGKLVDGRNGTVMATNVASTGATVGTAWSNFAFPFAYSGC